MYQFESRVRFSETDVKFKLTPGAIIDYFQDCSNFQSEELAVGFSYLVPRNLAWVLVYWQIEIEELPTMGDNIVVGTMPYDFKGLLGKRNFYIKKDDKMVVKADSLWTLFDMTVGKPTKVPEEIIEKYSIDEKLEMEYCSRKIKVSGIEQKADSFRIQTYHLDCNYHVNNGQYIKLASAYLPKEYPICRIRAEYRNQAFLDDEIFPYIYREDKKITVCLCNVEKTPYVVVEFEGK